MKQIAREESWQDFVKNAEANTNCQDYFDAGFERGMDFIALRLIEYRNKVARKLEPEISLERLIQLIVAE